MPAGLRRGCDVAKSLDRMNLSRMNSRGLRVCVSVDDSERDADILRKRCEIYMRYQITKDAE